VDAVGERELEIVLDEGRNRQIRRMIEPQGATIVRLVRTAIGPLQLGRLAPGAHRLLSERERAALDAALPPRP
jgi:23S rRNA pseudouridine2605 synthase